MPKNKIKNEKAITLIALIVTIIVLLILAGVSIAVLTGENGILNRASEAKNTNEEAEIIENIRLAYNNAQIGKYAGKNENFAEKMQEDLVKTYGTGNATVTSSGENTYLVTVKGRKYNVAANGNVTRKNGVNLSKTSTKLKQNDEEQLTVTLDPGITGTVTWSSNNPGVVSVTTDGKIKALAASGEAKITAQVGTEHKDECTVSIAQAITAISTSNISLAAGETKAIVITTTPNSGTLEDITYTFSSSDETKATVDENGNVRGVADGTATITIHPSNGLSDIECAITVEAPQIAYVTWTLNNGTYQESSSTTAPSSSNLETDYTNGRWWNMKTTKNGIECYWVWIPRFAYIVSDVQNSSAKQIDVQLVGTNVTGTTTIDNKQYLVHPAFTFGSSELPGFWVAKFEASAYDTNTKKTTTAGYGGGDTTSYKVQVKPDVQSWRNIPKTSIFTVCQNMTQTGGALNGIASDSHMMRNSEWGAVAILSQSKYGIYNANSLTGTTANVGDSTLKVWTNSNGTSYSDIKTGYVGLSADANSATGVALYNTTNGPKASTTGTIYGVYDMAGGAWEYVAGLYSTSNIDTKYYDEYNGTSVSADTNMEAAITGWNGDYSNFVYSGAPVFVRGGCYVDGANAGVFASYGTGGSASIDGSFRPVWVAP